MWEEENGFLKYLKSGLDGWISGSGDLYSKYVYYDDYYDSEDYVTLTESEKPIESLVLDWFSQKIEDGCFDFTLKIKNIKSWKTNLYYNSFDYNNISLPGTDNNIYLFYKDRRIIGIIEYKMEEGSLVEIKYESKDNKAQSFIVLGQDLPEFFKLMDIALINLTD